MKLILHLQPCYRSINLHFCYNYNMEYMISSLLPRSNVRHFLFSLLIQLVSIYTAPKYTTKETLLLTLRGKIALSLQLSYVATATGWLRATVLKVYNLSIVGGRSSRAKNVYLRQRNVIFKRMCSIMIKTPARNCLEWVRNYGGERNYR